LCEYRNVNPLEVDRFGVENIMTLPNNVIISMINPEHLIIALRQILLDIFSLKNAKIVM
jgi:hypothetical protein